MRLKKKYISLESKHYYSAMYKGDIYVQIVKYLLSLKIKIPDDFIEILTKRNLQSLLKVISDSNDIVKSMNDLHL
jgi:hypothetical protein